MLASCWHHAGIMLASCWHHAGIMLHHAGIMLASCWHHAGITLECAMWGMLAGAGSSWPQSCVLHICSCDSLRGGIHMAPRVAAC
jgi:hypothetical protein